jgi:hypothetical protein
MSDVSHEDEVIEVAFDGRLFARYRPYATPRPHFDRLLVDGVPLTRDLSGVIPEGSDDHPHHPGVWWGHREVNGHDLWTGFPGHGSIVTRGDVQQRVSHSVHEIAHEADWLDAAGTVLLSERRVLRAFPPAADGTQALDLDATLVASAGTVTLGDTKEAGLVAVRVAPSLEGRRGGRIQLSSGEVGETEAWGRPATWCAYAGVVDGVEVGLVVMDHPDNPRHPVSWHVRDYGLLAANPFGYSDFVGDGLADGAMTIAAGDSVRFRHRVLTFGGGVDTARIDRHFDRFAVA